MTLFKVNRGSAQLDGKHLTSLALFQSEEKAQRFAFAKPLHTIEKVEVDTQEFPSVDGVLISWWQDRKAACTCKDEHSMVVEVFGGDERDVLLRSIEKCLDA